MNVMGAGKSIFLLSDLFVVCVLRVLFFAVWAVACFVFAV